MSAFDHALRFVLQPEVEGGLSDHPEDPGKRTNLGITTATLRDARRVIPALPPTVDMLTTAHAKLIYAELYWKPAHCDELPASVALFTFDAAIQHDPRDAVRFVQLALRLKPDGSFGPATRRAVQRVKNWTPVLREIAARRVRHYMLLDNLDDTFGLGWARRVLLAYDAAKGLL